MAERGRPTVSELKDEIEQRDRRIKELRQEIGHLDQEHDRLRDLLTQTADHVEDGGNVIERWRERMAYFPSRSGDYTTRAPSGADV